MKFIYDFWYIDLHWSTLLLGFVNQLPIGGHHLAGYMGPFTVTSRMQLRAVAISGSKRSQSVPCRPCRGDAGGRGDHPT